MKILKISGRNFMPFKEIDLSLDGLGLTMIDGWNHDDQSASGSGKTSIFDLISFILFEKSPRDIKSDGFIHDGVKKGCEGIMDLLLDDGRELKITRTRKPEDLFFIINNGEPQRGQDKRETQKLLEKIVKLDYNTFVNAIYFSQRTLLKFISASDKDKRDILTKILDLELFDETQEIAHKYLKEKEAELSLKTNDHTNLHNMKGTYSHTLSIEKTNSEEFEQERQTKIDFKIEKIKKIKEDIIKKKEEIKTHSKEIVLPEIPKPDFNQIDSEINKLELFENPEQLELSGNTGQLEPPSTEEYDKLEKELQRKVEVKDQLQAKIDKIIEARSEYRVLMNSTIEDIQSIQSTGVGTCPTCLQEVTEEHLQTQLVQKQEKYNYAKKMFEEFSNKLNKLNEMMGSIESAEDDLRGIENTKRKLELEYNKKLKDIEIQKNLIERTKADNEKKKVALQHKKELMQSEYEKALLNRNNQLNELKTQNENKINRINVEIQNLVNEAKNINENINEIKEQKNRHLEQISKIEQDIIKIKKDIDDISSAIETIHMDIEALQTLKVSYKNIKYYIFESTIDELNMRIDKYLEPLFFEDIKVEFRFISGKNDDNLKFSTTITKNGVKKELESLSEGELGRVDLATKFALSDIVSMRKASSLNLMILDETFNGLPEECRERVVNLLDIIKNDKDNILIIDHFKAMQNMIENTIRVEKKDGESKVV